MVIWKNQAEGWVQETSLVAALGLDFSARQVIAAVGGGGKTSALQLLAAELRDAGRNVLLTTTTHMLMPEAPDTLTADPVMIRERLIRDHFAMAGHPAGHGKMAGVSQQLYDELCELADIVLVEADGSKQLPLKLPAEHEPVIPVNATHVLVLAGLSALDQPLATACHRPELVMKLLGQGPDHCLHPEDLALMIRQGYWMPFIAGSGRTGTVILNQADHPALLAQAADIASRLSPIPCLATQLK